MTDDGKAEWIQHKEVPIHTYPRKDTFFSEPAKENEVEQIFLLDRTLLTCPMRQEGQTDVSST